MVFVVLPPQLRRSSSGTWRAIPKQLLLTRPNIGILAKWRFGRGLADKAMPEPWDGDTNLIIDMQNECGLNQLLYIPKLQGV